MKISHLAPNLGKVFGYVIQSMWNKISTTWNSATTTWDKL